MASLGTRLWSRSKTSRSTFSRLLFRRSGKMGNSLFREMMNGFLGIMPRSW